MPATRLYLASRSPRRRDLLQQIGIAFETVDIDVDESRRAGEIPMAYVQRIAEDKARAGVQAAADDRPVLGADTTVALGERLLGKPANEEDAVRMLLALSGRTHEVWSAVAVATQDRLEGRVQVSRVSFVTIDERVARAYWTTGEPADKAGAYAIQGLAAAFIAHLEGSYSGVMGLPLFETAELCRAFGISLLVEENLRNVD